jgi:hypothetical protein
MSKSKTHVSIETLIPNLDHYQIDTNSEKSQEFYLLYDTWDKRLGASYKTNIGHAASGGFFSKAVFDSFCLNKISLNKQRFSNQIVVELGAGCFSYGYLLATMLGASSYIGVEPYYADLLAVNIESTTVSVLNPIPYSIISEDMLKLLRRLPNETVSVMAFGIEKCIISNERYRKNVESEIERVLHPLGCFVTSTSDLILKEHPYNSFFIKRKKWIDKGFIFTRR